MSSAKDIAGAFSISGLLDESSKTRERFPIVEIAVDAIEGHPANVAYSMDERSIKTLARSIRKDGLTDIPLVRKLDDGSWQMISGHRRLEAFRLLAEDDEAFAKIPCRIIEGISDSQAVVLLHTANYFVRALTVTERAAPPRPWGSRWTACAKRDRSSLASRRPTSRPLWSRSRRDATFPAGRF